MLLFVSVFALARFFVAAAAMDTGSAFEGMGAAREVTFAALAEPALIFGMLALTRLSGSLSLSDMLDLEASAAWHRASPSVVLIIVSWFIVLLAENARVPFDDPSTHLELTMIHEVMVLDHGGPAFGLVVYGAALKLTVFAVLLSSILVPAAGLAAPAQAALSLAAILAHRSRRGARRVQHGAAALRSRAPAPRHGDAARRIRRRSPVEVTHAPGRRIAPHSGRRHEFSGDRNLEPPVVHPRGRPPGTPRQRVRPALHRRRRRAWRCSSSSRRSSRQSSFPRCSSGR